MPTQKKGGGSRKIGRNKAFCTSYVSIDTQMKNKKPKIIRHLKKFSNDEQAFSRFKSLFNRNAGDFL